MKPSNRIEEARKQIRIASDDIQGEFEEFEGEGLNPSSMLVKIDGILSELQVMCEVKENGN